MAPTEVTREDVGGGFCDVGGAVADGEAMLNTEAASSVGLTGRSDPAAETRASAAVGRATLGIEADRAGTADATFPSMETTAEGATIGGTERGAGGLTPGIPAATAAS